MDSRDLKDRRNKLRAEVVDYFNEEMKNYSEKDEYIEFLIFEEGVEDLRRMFRNNIEEIEDIEALKFKVDKDDDWDFGIHFIRSEEFEDYCKEQIQESGVISHDLPAIIENNIDWEGIADDMESDYKTVYYRGIDYLYRV